MLAAGLESVLLSAADNGGIGWDGEDLAGGFVFVTVAFAFEDDEGAAGVSPFLTPEAANRPGHESAAMFLGKPVGKLLAIPTPGARFGTSWMRPRAAATQP